MVGRRGADASCPRALELTECTFTGCTVDSGVGAGGAVAVFDTTAVISGCVFEGGQGTAVLFESSSADGMHKIEVSACLPWSALPCRVRFETDGCLIDRSFDPTILRGGGGALFMGPRQCALRVRVFCFALT